MGTNTLLEWRSVSGHGDDYVARDEKVFREKHWSTQRHHRNCVGNDQVSLWKTVFAVLEKQLAILRYKTHTSCQDKQQKYTLNV